ncbi:MAG: Uma2 family endonuclease [Planctomycetia bacterium]|nr:Uma2 family endonuclease [Planctomycetia bacterium]
MNLALAQATEVKAPYLCFEMAGALLTEDEFDAVTDYDEGYRYELIHGVLVVHPIPLPEETDPNEELGHWLRTFKLQHPQASILDATMPQQYVRTKKSRRLADRLLWIGLGRLPKPRVDVATVAVEFVSAGRRNRERDYEIKQREYLEAGIREYWIVNRFQRILTVWRQTPTGPEQQVIPESEIYRSALLPGFELPLAQLLAVADCWAANHE